VISHSFAFSASRRLQFSYKKHSSLYCIVLHTCQHAGALLATTRTSPTPRRRNVTSKYSNFSHLHDAELEAVLSMLLVGCLGVTVDVSLLR
jgi:hypothetical protein